MITPEDSDISVVEAFRRINRRKRMVIAFAVGGAIIGLTCGLLIKPVFRSEILFALESQDDSKAPGILKQISGLASVAGVKVPGGDSGESEVAVASILTYSTLAAFAVKLNLEETLIHDEHCSSWLKCLLPEPRHSAWQAVQVLREYMNVAPERGTGLIKLQIEWFEPRVAADWANTIMAMADAQLRAEAQQKAKSRLDFIRAELARTDVVSVREGLAGVMETELRRLATAGADRQFAFRVIDPAIAAEKPVRPHIGLLAITIATLSAMIAAMYAVLVPRVEK